MDNIFQADSQFSATKVRLENETENRHKVEQRLRRVRSEMTRAKIKDCQLSKTN